jgi:cellulose synthase/poly-beta-1,6-N-acetylglucosamine synthase-like glycosyltransferase
VKIVFLLSLIAILYTYFGYPLAMWALVRVCTRKHIVATIKPSVSVVLAVHNGIERLNAKIMHLLDLDYSKIKEIIIVSDGSTDGTAEFLHNLNLPRIKTVVLSDHAGKAVAVNAGVALATGEVVLFVDIRPEIAPGAIQQLVNNFADPAVGCVAGELVLKQDGHDAASEAVGGLYWRYEQWIRKCEAAFDSPVGVYGGFYAIRRNLFTPMPAGIILDDMFQPLSIIRQGYRSVLDGHAFVYDVWPKKVEGEFHRKVRTLAGNFQLFQMAPWTLTPINRTVLQLASHKVMRLVVPYLMVLLLISSAALSPGSNVFRVFTGFQVLGWGLALAGLRYRIPGLHRLISPASALLVLNAAAVVGLYRFLFTSGPLWKIWNLHKPQGLEQMSAPSMGLGNAVAATMTEDASLVRK